MLRNWRSLRMNLTYEAPSDEHIGQESEQTNGAMHIAEQYRHRYRQLLTKAVEQPNHIDTLIELGDICIASGMKMEAEAWYKRALNASSNSKIVQDMIASKMPLTDLKPEPIQFYREWEKVVAYPLREGGWVTLLVAAIAFATAANFIQNGVPPFNILFFLINIVFYLALIAYLVLVIESTLAGKNSLPSMFGRNFDLWDVLLLGFRGVVLFLFYTWPLLVYYFAYEHSQRFESFLSVIVIVWAMVTYPASLGIMIRSSFQSALNPMRVFTLIFRLGARYFAAVTIAAMVLSVTVVVARVSPAHFERVDFLILLFEFTVLLYTLCLAFHIIGRVFADNPKAIGIE